jgi:hypothetical protein
MVERFTASTARRVAEILRPTIEGMMTLGVVHRQAFYILFAVPAPTDPWYKEIFTTSYGKQPQGEWEFPYDQIAHGKGRITGRTRLPSRVVQLMKPHLLLPDDVRFWGSWIEENIVVAGSGVEPWYDEAICKMACGLVVAGIEQDRFALDEVAEAADSVFYDARR